MSVFQHAKLLLVDISHLAKDALHIYVALLVFFGSCLQFRWKASQIKPLLLVLVAALAGEAWDLRDQIVYGDPFEPDGHLKDVINTLAVPTIVFLLARYSAVFRGKRY